MSWALKTSICPLVKHPFAVSGIRYHDGNVTKISTAAGGLGPMVVQEGTLARTSIAINTTPIPP